MMPPCETAPLERRKAVRLRARPNLETAPSFQAANALNTKCGELRSPMPSRSPKPRPRSDSAAAS